MTKIPRSPNLRRSGFSLLEVQAAFIVLGLSMSALVPFAISQLKLVAELEKQLPPNATYVMMSRDHGMVSLLANGGGTPVLNRSPNSTAAPSQTSTPNVITVSNVQAIVPGGPMDMQATVQVSMGP